MKKPTIIREIKNNTLNKYVIDQLHSMHRFLTNYMRFFSFLTLIKQFFFFSNIGRRFILTEDADDSFKTQHTIK